MVGFSGLPAIACARRVDPRRMAGRWVPGGECAVAATGWCYRASAQDAPLFRPPSWAGHFSVVAALPDPSGRDTRMSTRAQPFLHRPGPSFEDPTFRRSIGSEHASERNQQSTCSGHLVDQPGQNLDERGPALVEPVARLVTAIIPLLKRGPMCWSTVAQSWPRPAGNWPHPVPARSSATHLGRTRPGICQALSTPPISLCVCSQPPKPTSFDLGPGLANAAHIWSSEPDPVVAEPSPHQRCPTRLSFGPRSAKHPPLRFAALLRMACR